MKPYDCEEKQMRHVQIHAAVQSANMLRKDALNTNIPEKTFTIHLQPQEITIL